MRWLKRLWDYFKLKPGESFALGPFGIIMRVKVRTLEDNAAYRALKSQPDSSVGGRDAK